MYFSFYCNTSSGQVSFKAPNGTYRVEAINPSTRKFVIQVKHAENLNAKNSRGYPQLNHSLPFNATDFSFSSYFSSEVEAEVLEISWIAPALEPNCTLPKDCEDWPNSTCQKTRDGKRRCLCNQNFLWSGSTLNCAEG
jgi:hypothetical protein